MKPQNFFMFSIVAIIILALIVSFKVIIIPVLLLIAIWYVWNKFFNKDKEEDI